MSTEPPATSALEVFDKLLVTTLLVVVAIVVAAPILSGLGVLAWQVYSWAQLGEWPAVSMIDAILWLNADSSWLHSPTSWVGIWKFLSWLPASVGGALLSLVLLILVGTFRFDR